MQNPFDRGKDPLFWEQWDNQAKYQKLFFTYASNEVEEYDRSTLVPEVWARLGYVEEILAHFSEEICEDPETASHLDTVLRPLLIPSHINVKQPAPKVGQDYLKSVQGIIRGQFLKPIAEFKAKYLSFKADPDAETLLKYLNEAKILFDSIATTSEEPFTYHLKGFGLVKNLQTGQEVVSPPQEFSLITYPFVTRLQELVKVSRASADSIDLWAKGRRERRKEFTAFMAAQSAVTAASIQRSSSIWLSVFQVLVIVFTLAAVFLADRANLYFNAQRTSEELSAVKMAKADLEKQLETIRTSRAKLEEEIESLRAQVRSKKDSR